MANFYPSEFLAGICRRSMIFNVGCKFDLGCSFEGVEGSLVSTTVLSGDYLLCIGHIGMLVVMAWKVEVSQIKVWGQPCLNTEAMFINHLNLEDVDVIPTGIVSPLHLWLAHGKRIQHHSGVVF